MKKIAILGSTGSIGTQTLEIAREREDIQVLGLAAGSQIQLLEKQIREFHPLKVAVWDPQKAKELAVAIQDIPTKVLSGMEGLLEVATMEQTEMVVTAIVGMIGIQPTIAAIQERKQIALANKETLVTAGHLIMPMAKQMGVRILPVDSEHSAIFQSLNGEKREQVQKLLLTASGGPFRTRKKEELQDIQVEDALAHPTWTMGRKITIDSATMVNKGLEVMEARWLFDIEPEKIQVIVHPQSVIHSMIEFVDGAIMAQLGTPDMKLPIQYALCYPNRHTLKGERLDFSKLKYLTFEEPDMDTFDGLKLAYEAAKEGGSMPTVYNAANEIAVRYFLDRKITFLNISDIIRSSMEDHRTIMNPTLQQVLHTEQATYEYIEKRW